MLFLVGVLGLRRWRLRGRLVRRRGHVLDRRSGPRRLRHGERPRRARLRSHRQAEVHARLEHVDSRAQRGDLSARLAQREQRLSVPLRQTTNLGQQLAEGRELALRLRADAVAAGASEATLAPLDATVAELR